MTKKEATKTTVIKKIIKGEKGFVDDIEGNTYNTIKIGNQVWMVQNLRTTTYNDGTKIRIVTNNEEWAYMVEPAYCWYENTSSNKYNGALYNYYVIKTNKLCPTGWHIPTYKDYLELTTFLGGKNVAGKWLKDPDYYNDNEINTGFDAYPVGIRNGKDGSFRLNKSFLSWYGSASNSDYTFQFTISDIEGYCLVLADSAYCPISRVGLPVRCVKD
ncbi:MAG: fibrobacter succinogenes major paralogous domain-containing protein [Bacteroidales bacterium]|nr:fibrobacter succinogenes major paralogous domain-containing protein [Bacteroidales bacterium]